MVRILNYSGCLVALVAWVGLQLVPAAIDLGLNSPWNSNTKGDVSTAPWNAEMSSSMLTVDRYWNLNQRGGGLDSPWTMNLDAPWNMKNVDAPWNMKNFDAPWNMKNFDAPWNMKNVDAPWTTSTCSRLPSQDALIVGHATGYFNALDRFFA